MKTPDKEANREMKEKIEGILKEEKKLEVNGEAEADIEEEELNSEDDVSGALTRV